MVGPLHLNLRSSDREPAFVRGATIFREVSGRVIKAMTAPPRPWAYLALAAVLACGTERPHSSPHPSSSSASPTGDHPAAETQQVDSTTGAAPAADAEPADDLLTFDGWGPLRIGMSRAEVVAAAGEDAHPDAVGGPEPDRCDEFRPSDAPPGVLVMIENDVFTRVSVSRNPDIRTPDGFRIGDPGAAVIAKHGPGARVEPHKYLEAPAKYITIWRAPSPHAEPRGIRYETGPDDQIVHIRAGGASIEYVEGCL